MANHLGAIVQAEAQNLQESTRLLGSTTELISDFDDAYQALARNVKYPSNKSEDEQYAFLVILHLFGTCCRDLTVSSLMLLRAYWGDSSMLLRRTIDACASARRISKHHPLGRIWADASQGTGQYRVYKREFKSANLFPTPDSPDYEVLLHELYTRYDQFSKRVHVSIYGVSSHTKLSKEQGSVKLDYKIFDLPPNHTLITSLYMILDTHKRVLSLFGEMLKPYSDDFPAWQVRLNSLLAKLDLHREKWKPYVPTPRQRSAP